MGLYQLAAASLEMPPLGTAGDQTQRQGAVTQTSFLLDVVVHVRNLSVQKAEAGGSGAQGQLQIHGEWEVSLDCITHPLKSTQKNTEILQERTLRLIPGIGTWGCFGLSTAAD